MARFSGSGAVRHRLALNSWQRTLGAAFLFFVLLALVILPVMGVVLSVIWFGVMVFVALAAFWFLSRSNRRAVRTEAPPLPIPVEAQPLPIREVMCIRVAYEVGGVQVFRGSLRASADLIFEKLKQAYGQHNVPLLQEGDDGDSTIMIMRHSVEAAVLEKPVRPWINWLLFGLTILTTTWVGAAYQGVDLLHEPGRFATGLPYSMGLLLILGVHELGHFFAGRYHGMNVTPPYFIPVPFALGTFGAFIKMRSPAEDRRSLFDVAVAGPICGLVAAIPILWFGIRSSTVITGGMDTASHAAAFGPLTPSLLFGLIAKAAMGPALTQASVITLSPLAFAGWLGLFITALNLIPIGQLDGGHMTRAMFGNRVGGWIGSIGLLALFALALFRFHGLMIWAVIVFFLAGRASPPLNDLTPITPGRRVIGWFTYVLLALMIIPMPASW